MSEELERRIDVVNLQRDVTDMKAEIAELRNDIQDLVVAWRTSQGVVAFVKWLSGVALAVGILWQAFKQAMGKA